MFKIVALVYLIGANGPLDTPTAITYKRVFDGLEKCTEHLKSEEFASKRAGIASAIAGLIKQPEDEPPIAVTITASCMEDDRL
jgi:hypothetical protein